MREKEKIDQFFFIIIDAKKNEFEKKTENRHFNFKSKPVQIFFLFTNSLIKCEEYKKKKKFRNY